MPHEAHEIIILNLLSLDLTVSASFWTSFRFSSFKYSSACSSITIRDLKAYILKKVRNRKLFFFLDEERSTTTERREKLNTEASRATDPKRSKFKALKALRWTFPSHCCPLGREWPKFSIASSVKLASRRKHAGKWRIELKSFAIWLISWVIIFNLQWGLENAINTINTIDYELGVAFQYYKVK